MNVGLLIKNVNLATMSAPHGYGEILDAVIAISAGKIAWLGSRNDFPTNLVVDQEFDAQGGWLTPGLIDCHTHLVYAGNRSDEFEMRLEGKSYAEISQAGGGILSTVSKTRNASQADLTHSAQNRLDYLVLEGVTTVEVKSGYGLDMATELKMLTVAGDLKGAEIKRTLLAAHALPPEFVGDSEGYIDLVCSKIIPAARSLCDAVDAFCETIAFTPSQTARVFQAAKSCGLPVKLHADQLSDLGGAGLAAEYGALSADHVEYSSPDSVAKMKNSGTVAVLLPGAFYSLRETQRPPVALFRENLVPMAIATDHNPGTSPCLSLLLMMNMATVLFGLTPAEALSGVTKHAAKALGIHSTHGTLEVGKVANLALYAIDHPRDLSAKFGVNPCTARWRQGKIQ